MLIRYSVKDQVYEFIRERILRGEFVPGSVVNIAQLSAELETSNTPVREALSSLESDGLIVKNGSRYNVMPLSDKLNEDVDQVFSILLLGAFDLCVQQEKLDELAGELRRAFEEQSRAFGEYSRTDEKKDFKEKDFYDYLCKTMEFDRAFVKVSDNALLLSCFEPASMFLMLAISAKHKGNIEDNLREHLEILKAVERRDAELTRKLITAHFDKPLSEYPV